MRRGLCQEPGAARPRLALVPVRHRPAGGHLVSACGGLGVEGLGVRGWVLLLRLLPAGQSGWGLWAAQGCPGRHQGQRWDSMPSAPRRGSRGGAGPVAEVPGPWCRQAGLCLLPSLESQAPPGVGPRGHQHLQQGTPCMWAQPCPALPQVPDSCPSCLSPAPRVCLLPHVPGPAPHARPTHLEFSVDQWAPSPGPCVPGAPGWAVGRLSLFLLASDRAPPEPCAALLPTSS